MKGVTTTLLMGGLLLPFLSGCHRTESVQRGYRGQNSAQIYSETTLKKLDDVNKYPKPLKAAKTTGKLASEVFNNVHVLGDLTESQFARTMLSIKAWVAPQAGCNFCHNAPEYANDDKYQKTVAREMLKMTRHINSDWTQHVGKTGVTCFTCHRGNAVPSKTWYLTPAKSYSGQMVDRSAVHLPTAAAGNTALSMYSLNDYLLGDENIRVVGPTALQTGNRRSVYQARDSYGLMMVMAESLGVNCTFCHYTPAFYNWDMSTPQRATAWYGIRMVRDLNNNVIVPLTSMLPKERLGPAGDAPKIYCATCHQGANKPLYGAPMLEHYPELVWPSPAVDGAKPVELPPPATAGVVVPGSLTAARGR